ncbi:nectin-4 isoform X2 [Pseudoliparis swirei]|uniref:nectin-4 isoform X2 n=1 Tax=Pseudoliparis swirei TaxID=2059687 RepID=UPI0024BDA7DB|nr:nectin-4 isoform X2 [Pseudoliparis swirei]
MEKVFHRESRSVFPGVDLPVHRWRSSAGDWRKHYPGTRRDGHLTVQTHWTTSSGYRQPDIVAEGTSEFPPVTSLKDDCPTVGDEEVSLVTCMAAGAKPPAEVQWLTDTLGEKARQSISVSEHADGTTTTVSSLFGVPTREIDRRSVECVVTSAAMSKEESLPFTIQIYFSPIDVIISETSEGAFECVTEAKPKANITWSRSDQSRPQSTVKVDGATLQFPSMTSDLNGLYQCEASNLYGIKRNYVYVHVTSGEVRFDLK